MKSIPKVVISLGVMFALVVGGALLLFAVPSTGWKALTVQTGSMSPTIPSGSMVFVHSVPSSSLKVGDVITYTSLQKRNGTITHRITQKYLADGRVPSFITKGDSNTAADAPIVGGQVKGKVVGHIPYLGTVVNFIKSWPGIIAIIYLPALLVIIDELRRLAYYYKSLMPYKDIIVLAREELEPKSNFKFAAVPIISTAILAGSILFAFPVHALFQTNTVQLVNGSINITSNTPTCLSSNNNNISVTSNTTQTSTTGDANNSGNTTGGSATSGDATNTNNTNTNITITNC